MLQERNTLTTNVSNLLVLLHAILLLNVMFVECRMMRDTTCQVAL